MRFRTLAAVLLLPVGLLVACGGEDDGLVSGSDDSSDTTEASDDEDSSDDTDFEPGSDDTTDSDSDLEPDSDDEDALREQAIEAFMEFGLSEDDAECLVDAIGVDQLIDIGLSSGGDISDVDPDQINVIVDAIGDCDIDPTVLSGDG